MSLVIAKNDAVKNYVQVEIRILFKVKNDMSLRLVQIIVG